MLKKWILLLVIILVASLILPAGATQYNPPWAHNYGFLYPDGLDTRSHALFATNVQDLIFYDANYASNTGAHSAFVNIQDDAVFYVNGHGVSFIDDGTAGGGVIFYNGTSSLLLAQYTDWLPPDDAYFLSDFSTEINDVLLAVYVACWSGRTCPHTGNLVDMSASKGIDNVIGFKNSIDNVTSNYWSDRFFYRCKEGFGGQHQLIIQAATYAKGDVLLKYQTYGGVDSLYGKYRTPWGYLDPARYGVV